MGVLADEIQNLATQFIPVTPALSEDELLDGPELLKIFGAVEDAVRLLEDRAAGSVILRGYGQPNNSTGADIDLYLDRASGDVWGKETGSWVVQINLMGPQGDPGLNGSQGDQGPQGDTGATGANGTNGADGADGEAGADGNKIKPYTANPGPGDGHEEDLAINATTGDLLEKTSSGWVVRGNLKGPKGDKGDTGATGGSGSGGGTGTVKSVNGSLPDVNGNVTVTIPDPLPSQLNQNKKFLSTNGTAPLWASPFSDTTTSADTGWSSQKITDYVRSGMAYSMRFKTGDLIRSATFFNKVLIDSFRTCQGGSSYTFKLVLADGTVAATASNPGAITVAIGTLTTVQVTAGYDIQVEYTGGLAVATAILQTFIA